MPVTDCPECGLMIPVGPLSAKCNACGYDSSNGTWNARFVDHVAYVEIDPEWKISRWAACTCGWKGPQRSTLEVVTDDALAHEREFLSQVEKPCR